MNYVNNGVLLVSEDGECVFRFLEVYLSAQFVQPSLNERELLIFLDDPEHITKIASKLMEASYRGFEQLIGNHPSTRIVKDFARKKLRTAALRLYYMERMASAKRFLVSKFTNTRMIRDTTPRRDRTGSDHGLRIFLQHFN